MSNREMVMVDERNITYDFGFTIVDESELDAYQQAQEAKEKLEVVSGSSQEMEDKLHRLYNAIQPLLNNLKKKRLSPVYHEVEIILLLAVSFKLPSNARMFIINCESKTVSQSLPNICGIFRRKFVSRGRERRRG